MKKPQRTLMGLPGHILGILKGMIRKDYYRSEFVITSEAILAEVAFVLTSKRHYSASVEAAAEALATAIRLRLKFPPGMKRQYLRALELWVDHPALGFVDALTAAIVEHSDNALGTFDSDFDELDGILYWRPDNGHQDEEVLC